MFRLGVAALSALILAAAPLGAASLVTSAGKVTGAKGIFYDDGDIGTGDWWDVQFREGDCVATLDGCNTVSDFAMNTQGKALGFAGALIAQVYEAFPAVDDAPDSVRGCVFAVECSAIIAWGFQSPGVAIVMAKNGDASGSNNIVLLSTSGFPRTADPNPGGSVFLYIAQGVEPSAVPLPAAAPLLLAGLGGLVALRRRR